MSQKFRREMQPPAWLAPFARHVEIESDGRCWRIFYYDTDPSATKPPLVLVHGLADEADTWRHVILPLCQSHRVIALDLPGFGRSSKHRTAYTLDLFEHVVVAFLDALRLDRVTLVGNSLGGIISHIIALQHAERVENLVLVAGLIVLKPGKGSLDLIVRSLPGIGEWLYTRLRRDPHMAFETLRGYYADFDHLPQADRVFLFQRVNERVWSDEQRYAYLSVRRNLPAWFARSGDVRARVPSITTPTLVVWGEDDIVLPITHGFALAHAQPSARLVSIPRAGHLPQQERPKDFLQRILGAD